MIPENRIFDLNKTIGRYHEIFYRQICPNIFDTPEMSYMLTALLQDFLTMNILHLKKCLPSQEAKAALKVILDLKLMDLGMHVKIDEFNS